MSAWRGPLAIENEQTGDGRVIVAGATEWDEGSQPLAYLTTGDQHVDTVTVAPQVGTIDRIWRDGDTIMGEGQIDDGNPDGAELVRRLETGTASHGSRQGVSIDPDNWQMQVISQSEDDGEETILVANGRGELPAMTAAAGDPDPGDDTGTVLVADDVDDVLTRMTRLRIRGATAVAVPAFSGAYIELVGSEAEEADEEPTEGEEPSEGVLASFFVGREWAPASDWFHTPEPDEDSEGKVGTYGMPAQELLIEQPDGGLGVPFTITEDRRVFGHAARWGQCHIGYPNTCVTAPESPSAYAHFHHGQMICDDGTSVATGPLTMGCDHAAAELRAPQAKDHYANIGLAFADVRASSGTFGIWVSGALRPDVTDEQVALLQASSLSGDWRRIGTDLEFIGALAVSVPGFPIAREAGITASVGASTFVDEGVQNSLVAAGIVQRCPECMRQKQADEFVSAGELLRLVREIHTSQEKVEMRTRHLTLEAAAHVMDLIRRG